MAATPLSPRILAVTALLLLGTGCTAAPPPAANAAACAAELEPGVWAEVDRPFDAVIAALPEALKAEGFGIVSQLDPQATFEKRLGKPFRKYRVFGACDPKLAFEILSADPKLGVLLPCSFAVYEVSPGRTAVGAIEPRRSIGAAAGERGQAMAADVRARLVRVQASLAK